MAFDHDGCDEKTGEISLRLSETGFEDAHRDGLKHQVADALSRLPMTGADESLLEDELPVLSIS